jgi:tetratricopeptide (TPR) repeat protein
LGAAQLSFRLNNRPAGEEYFRRLFDTDCQDAMFLNNAVWDYVEFGGTNLERGYELALKAQSLAPQDQYIVDTVGWYLFKRGYYQEALDMLSRLRANPDVAFHLGMTHYMLGDEDLARSEFQKVVRSMPELVVVGRKEAKKCLAILDLKGPVLLQQGGSKLKARLTEAPDDPVALSRLCELYESGGASNGRLRADDPFVMKALGVHAFQRGDYAHATDFLAQSSSARRADAELYFYLGLARNHLNQTNECADSLRKAVALGLKAAQREQATKVLDSLALSSAMRN